MDDHELERRVGTVLRGKWTLERLLGSGGMAAVYVAVHKIGRREAIKILHPEIARVPELRARFDQEARAVNQFVHPGAVDIADFDSSGMRDSIRKRVPSINSCIPELSKSAISTRPRTVARSS